MRLCILAMVCLPFTALSAQRSVHLGIAGGAAIPVGKFSDNYATKNAALITLAGGPQESPVGIRLDYSYVTFNGRRVLGKKYRDTQMASVTGNLVTVLPVGSAKPYLIFGGGWYPYREATDVKRENDFGLNGGAGVSFPFVIGAGFFEARYHRVHGRETNQRFVPVTLGIMF